MRNIRTTFGSCSCNRTMLELPTTERAVVTPKPKVNVDSMIYKTFEKQLEATVK
jgi:hypothetical protein